MIYNQYWYISYTYAMEPNDDSYILSKFSSMVLKPVDSKIDSKASRMFRKVYGHLYEIVQHYRSIE